MPIFINFVPHKQLGAWDPRVAQNLGWFRPLLTTEDYAGDSGTLIDKSQEGEQL